VKKISATLPIILNWLSWDLGDGHLIEVGRDCILDLGRKAILSPSLRAHLQHKNLVYLHQFFSPSIAGTLGNSCLSGLDLLLNQDHRAEWDNFSLLLKAAGVCLKTKPDSLIWMGGDRSGRLTAKNAYQALADLIWNPSTANWRQRIWKDTCPLKYKLFAWLMLENRLLFWDKLQARGWEGPNRCPLCAQDNESTLHVFVLCPFTQALWTAITSALNIPAHWSGNSVPSCFQYWIHKSTSLPMLPLHICWHIWLTRNAALFNDKKPSIPHVSYLILTEANKITKPHFKPAERRTLHIPLDRAVAWFDGASQHGGATCGAGGRIVLNSHSSILWTLNCNQGSNTKAELLGAWTSLFLASCHTDDLLLLGDSKITIDWLNGLADLRVAALSCWMKRTKEATLLFRKLSFQHIFREDNKVADSLSKKALHLPPNQILFSFWEDGHEGLSYKINL
jgi:ribonuclease HI